MVPFYNPGPPLRSHLERVIEVLEQTGRSFEVLGISDGCTDGSERSLDGLPTDRFELVVLESNRGKGAALRTGFSRGRGRYLGFIDGDGDVDPAVLATLWDLAAQHEADIALASKRHPRSSVHYPSARRLYSWGYQQLLAALFRLSVPDTQTGAKLVKREVLVEVLPVMVQHRFAFDLELLVAARRRGHTSVVEAPVIIKRRFSSTISLSAVVRILADTVAVFWRLHVRRAYDPGTARFDAGA